MMQRTELLGEDCRLTALGIRLREARERQQLSEEDVAGRLFLSVGQVKALEEARYEVLPAEVFVRGYLRSYARLLELDPDEILAQYRPPPAASAPPVEILDTDDSSKPSLQDRVQSLNLGRLLEKKPSLDNVSETGLMIMSGGVIALVVVLVVSLLFLGGDDEADVVEHTLTADPALFQVVDEAAHMGVNPPKAGGARRNDTSAAAATENRLEMEFSDDCWVEIRDSSRKILLADMRRAGDREVVQGDPPYKILLGKSEAVAIRYEGQRIAVEPEQGKEYAQLVIGW